MWHIHDNGDWFLMALVMALFWVPIALIGFGAVAQLGPKGRRNEVERRVDEPRETARRAYAAGEIDREQFLQIISDLDDTSHGWKKQ